MTFHSTNLPALPRRIFDLIEEYETKHAGAEDAVKTLNAAIDAAKMAHCVAGSYTRNLVDLRSSVNARDIHRELLKSAWQAAYKHLNIETVASTKDKAAFERALADPPPFTMDNIRATFFDYLARPRHHILKGLAEVFADLDEAYRSHSKVKIGVSGLPKRVVLPYMRGYGSSGFDKLFACLNALAAYRGEPLLTRADMVALDPLTRSWDTNPGGEATIRGQKVRVFMNGNAHLFFDKHALLDINRALAEFYGEVLPDAEDENAPRSASREVSKDLAYYPTPDKAAETLIYGAYIGADMTVLEPSCGCGRLLDMIRQKAKDVRNVRALGIEVHAGRADEARSKGFNVLTANFLDVEPSPDFDRVVMNPPFSGKHYLKHIRHALKFLKPDGRLVAILPATAWYDHGELTGDLKGEWRDLPAGSFSESGTNVPTGYIAIHKRG